MYILHSSDVIPDIVTIGKPMGNGHPVSALITSPRIADTHDAVSPSYFSTVRSEKHIGIFCYCVIILFCNIIIGQFELE